MTSAPAPRLQDRIAERLAAAYPDAEIRVEDESEQHRGHAGYREGGQTHFHVALKSESFAGLSRLARHRAVHAALGEDFLTALHALRMTLEA